MSFFPEETGAVTQIKRCTKCGEGKTLKEFSNQRSSSDGLKPWCRSCSREYNQKYYTENRLKLIADVKAYAAQHAEKKKLQVSAYQKKHRVRLSARKTELRKLRWPEFLAECREYDRRRSKEPGHRLKKNLRTRIYLALVGINKSGTTEKLLGCSIDHLRIHLESQFCPGMTWENYGPVWHVDHKLPCASFDLTDPVQQATCFHYSNLQPLFAADNIRKSDCVAV